MPAIPLSFIVHVHSLSHLCNLVSYKTTLYLNEIRLTVACRQDTGTASIQGGKVGWLGLEMARAWINSELKLLQFVGCWICWICNMRENNWEWFFLRWFHTAKVLHCCHLLVTWYSLNFPSSLFTWQHGWWVLAVFSISLCFVKNQSFVHWLVVTYLSVSLSH